MEMPHTLRADACQVGNLQDCYPTFQCELNRIFAFEPMVASWKIFLYFSAPRIANVAGGSGISRKVYIRTVTGKKILGMADEATIPTETGNMPR